jgi:hypothetical protein
LRANRRHLRFQRSKPPARLKGSRVQDLVRHRFVPAAGLGRSFVEAALERGDKVAATARNTDSLADLTKHVSLAAHG